MVCINFVDVTSNETAGEGTVRLVSSSGPHKGRLEVYFLGQWGTVCDNSWDILDATVVCKELGYLRAVGSPRSSEFGAGSGPSWFSYVGCNGAEQSLAACYSSDYNFGSACSHSQDAGVVCSSESFHACVFG